MADKKTNLREQAEGKAVQLPENFESLSFEETRQILHELQVHQIELEIQNEELRRTQEKLEESRSRYFDLYDLAPVGYVTLSEKGLIMEANLTMAKLLGVPRGALVRRPLTYFVLPADQDIYYKHQKKLFETGLHQTCEIRLTSTDVATPCWVRVDAILVKDAAGLSTCRIAMTDITKHKEAEDALQESEVTLRAFFDAVKESLVLIDIDGVVLLSNMVGAERLGKDVAEFVGTNLYDHFPPDVAKNRKEKYNQVIATGDPIYFEDTRAGRFFEQFCYPLLDRDKKVSGVTIFAHEITSRKKAEDALRESEDWHRTILETAMDGFWLADLQGHLLEVNDAYCRMSGYDKEELLNMSISDVEVREKSAEIAAHFQKVMSHGEDRFETTHRRKDGSLMELEISVQYKSHREGRTVAFLRDITDRKRAEEELHVALEKYRVLFDSFPLGISVTDKVGNIIETNRESERLLNIPYDEHTRRKYDGPEWSIIHPDGTPMQPDEYASVRAMKENCRIENVQMGIVKEGEEITWLNVTAAPIPLDNFGVAITYGDITNYMRAEEALRISEEQYRQLFENMTEGVALHELIYDEHGQAVDYRIIDTNPAYYKHTSLAPEQSHGQLASVLYGTNIPPYLDEYRRVAVTGEPIAFETFFPPIGKHFRIAVISPKRGFFATIFEDVTERKQAEGELKSANVKLESLWNVSSLSEASTKMVSDHVLESIARMTQSEYGFYGFITDDETVMIIHSWSGEAMKNCSMVDKPQRFPISEAGIWAEAIRRREPLILNDYGAAHKAKKGLPDGHVELTNLMVVPHFTKGRITSVAAVANRQIGYDQSDISQITAFLNSIQAIVDSKRAEEVVRESQQRLTDIIEFLPDATLVIDKDGKVIAWNRAIESMTGIKAEAMIGKDNYEYALPFYGERKPILIDIALHPDLTKEKSYTTIHRMGDVVFGEAYTPTLASGNIHLSGTASVLRNSTGEIVGAIECIRNNTDRKNMEERLQRAEKMEALGLLAGGVAHDLNNALGILVGYSELLYDGLSETDPLREDARNIMKGGEQAAAIVQDLLTLARRGVQTKTVININKTVNEYLKSSECLKLTSFHPTVRIRTELEGEILKIAASPVHLSKTLNNLIANAAEAMPSGGDILIHTENRYMDRPVSGYDTVQEGDYVVLSVTDEGEGISDDDMKRIFEPFYTKKVMGRSGTGLGLAVVWGTVKDHNGYIDVQSRRGEGTTFILYFPVTHEEIAEDRVTLLDEYMGQGEKILVIDDIKDQRDLATRILSKLNYQVEVVASGEEAVEYLKLKEADLIVLDMIMEPGIDGLDTYRQISAIKPKQKAIIVSGFAETERVKMAQSLGAGAFVKKPYVRERLGMAMRKELDRK